MDGSRRVNIAESKKIVRKTREKSDLSPTNITKKENTGILKKRESPRETPQDIRDNGRPRQENSQSSALDIDSVCDSGEAIPATRVDNEERRPELCVDLGLMRQTHSGEGRGEKLGGSKAVGTGDDDQSNSDLSEDELASKPVVDSDYDTDLDMDDRKWLYPEKYETDTTGRARYIKACQDEGVQPVRTFLLNMQEEHLVLKHHGLGPKAMKALATPLENNTSIETIDLEGNWIMAEGMACLCRVLRENVYVTRLNISENKLGNEGAVSVCNLLTSNRQIDHINLAGNDIGNPTIEDFYNILTQSGSVLKHLNLRHNNFDDASAQRFKDALVENESLEFLDLSWNNFQSKGCVLLAEGLKENVGLKELAVSMNGFGLEGGKALGKALQSNRTLYKLDASYCRLPIECTGEIALGLMNNDKLGVLDLSYNCMDADSALVVLTGLHNNDSSELHFFELGNTRVNLKFKEVADKLSAERGLVVQHGGVNEDYKAQIAELDPMEAFRRDPMTKLKEWLSYAGYRLIDLMRTFDKDQSMSISIREFREGIASTKIPLSEEQMQILIKKLDTDGDGEIDFSELVEGDKTHRKNKREVDKYVKEKNEKEKEKEKQEKLILDPSKKSVKLIDEKENS
ncbi:hypothetical protein EGW08_006971 [Elysia chlorotica]|uniref:EF-hand domain-containing protein n=1 Tax=Elysia chlorotica TaxID=188477 RepID=A0A433TUL3_ELYCH|nr:hypothetical protein EGW08_006971 [Elysia chlorotica]